jgi:histidine decarboxylase
MNGLSEEDQRQLDRLYDDLSQRHQHCIGYPLSEDFDYSPLYRFLKMSINNVGDPYEGGNPVVNTLTFEKTVVDYFAELFHADKQDFWGYITNGGTEGNLYCCYVARRKYPLAKLYFSVDSHYSVLKITNLLRMQPVIVKSLPNGEIDIDDLMERIIDSGDKTFIIWANVGTTMKGAVDNIPSIHERLALAGFSRNQYYLHTDAALKGLILPFVPNPEPFDFRADIDSIAVSGHKMIGSPIPCGVAIVKASAAHLIDRSIEYIDTHDLTIAGSRNAFTPLILWYAIKTHSKKDWVDRTLRCIHFAQYAKDRLVNEGVEAHSNPNSVTVYFTKPSEVVWRRYHLATQGDIAHIIILGHVRKPFLDQLLDDVIQDSKAKALR